MHSFGDTYMNKIAARYLLQIVAALKKNWQTKSWNATCYQPS